jgi:glycosyltransferase involved in cell wall biosynthesis
MFDPRGAPGFLGWRRPRSRARQDPGHKPPLSVGVFVDLKWYPGAGGHVKCWERFAEAAAQSPDRLDLTVHFLGEEEQVHRIGENVRYVTHPASLATSLFPFMERLPGDTDLSPFNPKVIPYLANYQVIHTTGAFFALSRTAQRFARRHALPVVNSIHTDTPSYTRVFAAQILRRFSGGGRITRLLLERFKLHEKLALFMRRRLHRYLSRCNWIMVSKGGDLERMKKKLSTSKISLLRRGIDKEAFHPRWRDRARLKQVFGIPPESFLLLFVGRLDDAKNALTFAEAVRLLLERGEPVRAMMVGEGSQKERIQKILGGAVSLPGNVAHSTLSWLYASADLFVFPSQTEVCPNAVIEARASGLPVVVSSRGGAEEILDRPGLDGLVVGDDEPATWARCIEGLRRSPGQLASMSGWARKAIEADWPTWRDVLETDLLPVWQAMAARSQPS